MFHTALTAPYRSAPARLNISARLAVCIAPKLVPNTTAAASTGTAAGTITRARTPAADTARPGRISRSGPTRSPYHPAHQRPTTAAVACTSSAAGARPEAVGTASGTNVTTIPPAVAVAAN